MGQFPDDSCLGFRIGSCALALGAASCALSAKADGLVACSSLCGMLFRELQGQMHLSFNFILEALLSEI